MDQQERAELVEIQAQAVQQGLHNYVKERRRKARIAVILGPIIGLFVVSNLFQFFVLGPLQTQRENGTLKTIKTWRQIRKEL